MPPASSAKGETPPGILLRPIRPEDERFLFRIYAEARAEELALLPWSADEKRAFLLMQFQAQHGFYVKHFAEAHFDIIEEGGRPLGRLYVDRRTDEIRVIDIALLPEHRRKGIGGGLLRGLLDEAAAGGKSVTIHVERNNPARRLYERLGFEHERDEGLYWFMRWRPPRRVRLRDGGLGEGR
jgi:ribosomal protein S18 acetylase RimI-like enzyme